MVAIGVNWVGNRYWTFRDQRRSVATREGIEFVVVSLGGMVISLGCLGISHYVLGFTSFRFWLYKVRVYHPDRVTRESAGRRAGQRAGSTWIAIDFVTVSPFSAVSTATCDPTAEGAGVPTRRWAAASHRSPAGSRPKWASTCG